MTTTRYELDCRPAEHIRVNALATALSVQPAALGDVMRELLR